MHTVRLSRMGPVPSLWRGSNRWSATVAWAKARLSRTVAQLLEPLTLRLGLRCSLLIPLRAAWRNGGGAIFSPPW